jgi:hypothetical protein
MSEAEGSLSAEAMNSADQARTNPDRPANKMTDTDTTKITATLPNEVVDDLRQLAADRHLTLSAALRQAITTTKFINDETRDGKLLIEKDDGELRQIVFR